MRGAFKEVVNEVFSEKSNLFLMLGDIGVFGFNQLISKHPERAINIGILEQTMSGMIAGLSKGGFTPIVHSIAPFLVERCYEQIKLAVGYHNSSCRLISIGASYDYINLGPTHHCPADIAILSAIPNLEIIIPASPNDFRTLFLSTLDRDAPIYFRLTDNYSDINYEVEYGKCRLIRKESSRENLVLSVGPMVDSAEKMARSLGFTHVNCTSLSPFDSKAIAAHLDDGGEVHVIEPYYEGSSYLSIASTLNNYKLRFYGFNKTFNNTCGDWTSLMEDHRLTPDLLKARYYET